MSARTVTLAVVGVCGLAVVVGVASGFRKDSARCRVSAMRFSVGARWSEKTGQHTTTVGIANRGGGACVLDGYALIVLLDRSGHVLPFTYSHSGDQMITARRPREVRVQAGGAAYFAFNKYRCDVQAIAVAATMRVKLPGGTGIRAVRLPHDPIIDFCRESPSRIVTISPIEVRLGNAAARP